MSSLASRPVSATSIAFPSAPQSRLEPSYWESLYKLKLDQFKLDNSLKEIEGVIPLSTSTLSPSFDCVSFSKESFNDYLPSTSPSPLTSTALRNPFTIQGTILNCNTVEEFKAIDKKEFIEKISANIWSKISSSKFELSEILRFSMITFADLKTYKFTYWLAFPAVIPATPYRLLPLPLSYFGDDVINTVGGGSSTSSCSVDAIDEPERTVLLKKVKIISGQMSGSDFLRNLHMGLHKLWSARLLEIQSASSASSDKMTPFHKTLAVILTLANDGSLSCLPFDETSFQVIVNFEASKNQSSSGGGDGGVHGTGIAQYWVGVQDGQSAKGSHVMSWHNRNVLAYIYSLFSKYNLTTLVNHLDIICIRGRFWTFSWNHSLSSSSSKRNEQQDITPIAALPFDENQDNSTILRWSLSEKYFQFDGSSISQAKVFGWELNDKDKPGPSVANLASTLDPATLMTQAIDLNIRLMRWRLWTSLENEKIAKTKCLLFGAGTLGCAIARCLLGWGVKHITLIDNGLVSYSNPARQMLFEFDDAVKRKPKATTAAERLRSIWPQVQAQGFVYNIPMPGHAYNAAVGDASSENGPEGAFRDTIDKLDSLVQEHDVIFNLTDSREARWFPTLLSAYHNKLMISVALGFDTYLVMRHGLRGRATACATNSKHRDEHVSCYFCSDIVAATNSMKDRSMDQQCTVTRPGSSFMSSGTAVELMVSYLHSLGYPNLTELQRDKNNAFGGAAASSKDDDGDQSEDVSVPHQIRGNLNGFTQFLPYTPAFPNCTACSDPIIAAYSTNKYEFMKTVCENPEILQDISGISDLTKNINDNCDWDDESEESGSD